MEFPSFSHQPQTSSKGSLTAMTVVGLLALGVQTTSSQSPNISGPEIRDRAIVLSEALLGKIIEELKTNISRKILDDTQPSSLGDIQEYITTELVRKGISNPVVLLQIMPLEESQEGIYNYMSVSILSPLHSVNLILTTDNIDKAFISLTSMRNNFVEELGQKAVATFIQEIKDRQGDFEQEFLEGKIHAALKSEGDACTGHCFIYNCVNIHIEKGTKTILLHIQIIDNLTGKVMDMYIPTGAKLKISRRSSGPMMMAQNTSGTQE